MNQIIIQETDFQKARKKIKEAKEERKRTEGNKPIVFSSNDDELNRKILEKEDVNILLLNMSGRKDKMKQRDSGFNQVLAKLAKKKDIILGINLDEIISSKGKEKLEILTRIRQNVKLCNRDKVKMRFISKEKHDNYNLKSLGLVLGMPTWMTKDI